MAAWITSAPTTPTLVGNFAYPNGFELMGWHLKHPSYAGNDISARWGASPSLVLGVERPSQVGVRWKKEVKQTIYNKGTSNKISAATFWLPVLIEGDPVMWDLDKKMHVNGGNTGTNFAVTVKYVYHLPIIATLNTVTDVVRLGDSASSQNYLDQFSPQLDPGPGGINPGRHVATFGNFDYYWEDTVTNPHFVVGTVSSKGTTVVNTSSTANPYINTIFVGKPSGFKSTKKVAQLYQYDVINIKGKNITPGMAFDGTGTPDSSYVYSQFAINVGKLSADPDSFSGKVPIVVKNDDYVLMNSWKNASQTVPQKPTSVPLYAANGIDGLPSYIAAFSSLWQQQDPANGFTVHQTTSWADWTSSSPSIDLGIGKWMVYPQHFVSSPKNEASRNIDAAKTCFSTGIGGVSFPVKGKHFGVFDNSTDANAWKTYYNQILKAGTARVTDQTGFVFIAGKDFSDGWTISINVDGLAGIVSANTLLANAGQSSPTVSIPPIVTIGSPDPGTADSADPGVAGGSGSPFRVTMQYAVNTVTKKNVNILIKQLMANEKLTFAQTKEKFIEAFVKARTAFLVASGKPLPEAKSIAESRANVIFASAAPNSNPGGTGSTSAAPPAATIRIPIVRGLIGYQPPPSALGDSPQLVQKYQYTQVTQTDTGSEVQTLVPTERRFIFPFTPKEVSYSNLSSVWTEINRNGRHPIVDWTGFQLLKVSFTFELVSRNSTDIAQPRDGFGLYYSIDEEINVLRQMATAPYPVSFLNMDTFFSKELRYPLYTQGRGVEFVITDFAVQSVQRTSNSNAAGITTIQPNQISRASCTMTLQECPIENVDIISIPKITVCSKTDCPPPTCKAPCVEKTQEFVLISPLTQNDTPPQPVVGAGT